MRFESARVAFCPQFVQIVSKAKKVKLCGDVRPTPGEETFEFTVVFQYAEGPFHLNGTVDSK
jgi:hypothetical protein